MADLAPDAAPASAHPWSGDRRGPAGVRPRGGRAPRVAPAQAGGHGALPGHAASGQAPGVGHGPLPVPVGTRRPPVATCSTRAAASSGTCLAGRGTRMGRGCWALWPATGAAGPSPTGNGARAMARRWSSGLPSGPTALGARRSGGRGASPWRRASGGGSSMCLRSGPWWGAPGACMRTPRARRWRVVGRHWARGRWRRRSPATGRPLVIHGERRLGSAVRSVGRGWWARPSSPGPAPHHQPRPSGSRSPAAERARGRLEAALQRRRVPCRGPPGPGVRRRAPRSPRPRRRGVHTAHEAGDVGRQMARPQSGTTLQAPERSTPSLHPRWAGRPTRRCSGPRPARRVLCLLGLRPLHADSFGGGTRNQQLQDQRRFEACAMLMMSASG